MLMSDGLRLAPILAMVTAKTISTKAIRPSAIIQDRIRRALAAACPS